MSERPKGFEVIHRVVHNVPYSDRGVGAQVVKCPECGEIFTQGIEDGFIENVSPSSCPKCGYPYGRVRE